MHRIFRPRKFLTLGLAAVFVSLLAGSSSVLLAQGTSYITGTVYDQGQKPVANAGVGITNEQTGTTLTVNTTDSGLYTSPSLDPGSYTVKVSASGFKDEVTTGVRVELGEPRSLDINLAVGSTQTVVTVTASAPLLNTQDPGLGQSVDYVQVAKLPYFDRSAGALLALTPSVRYTGEDPISYGASRYNIAGWTNVNVFIDGTPANGDREDVAQMVLNPTVEALSDVRVIVNQYSAEFGQDVGALVLMQTKSGSDQWHGGVYEYLRNEYFDSDNHFTHTKPEDRQQIFGGTFGGPILRRKKLYFFTSQEGQLSTVPLTAVLTVPTDAMKAGNFAGFPTIYDPASTVCAGSTCTRQAFLNNQIPTSRFDSVALNVLKYFPEPTLPGAVNNLPVSSGYQYREYRGASKIDWNISDKDNFSFLWLIDNVNNTYKGVPAYNAIDPASTPEIGSEPGFAYQSQAFAFTETHLLSTKTFVTNRVVWRPRHIGRINAAVNPAAMYGQKLGIQNYAGALLPQSFGGDLGFPTFNFTGYTGVGPGGGLLFQENPISEFDYMGSISLIRGSHSLKAGVQIERGRHGAPDQGFVTGSFTFQPTETGNPLALSSTGNAFASYLLGQVDSGSTDLGPLLEWRNLYVAPWFQDDWKVNPKLTVNLGLRWDIDFPVTEQQNRGNAFNPTAINPVSGTPGIYEFLGFNGWPSNFFNTQWKRFAPRFGFAYELTPTTVFRGGFGMYNLDIALGANVRAPSAGWNTNGAFNSTNSGVIPAFILSQGFPTYPLGGTASLLNASFGAVPVGQTPNSSPTYVDRNWRIGYAENFDLSVQKQLSPTISVEIAGQGALGRKLPINNENFNEVPPQFWGLEGANYARRPFPQFANVTDVKFAEGNVTYLGGYIKVDKRFSKSLDIIGNFNWGKPIGFMGGSIYYPQLSRTQLVYDEANGATGVPLKLGLVAWTYNLPFGPGRTYLTHGLVGNLLGGWDLNGILSAHSGVPYDISSGVDSLNGNSPLSGRVNLAPGVTHPQIGNPANRLNPANFVAPPNGTVGTFWGAKFYSPDNVIVNSTLGKNFVLHEGYTLRVVAEVFNLLNSPQWGIPNTTLNSPGFGVITGAGSNQGANVSNPQDGARVMQLGARVDF
jgi:Carboxypeptidase regulatory-like domain